MTDTEINIAIAEACGVVCDRCGGTGKYERYGKHEWFRMNMGGKLSDELRFTKCDHVTEDEHVPFCKLYPDYCHDLNAMHEAESCLQMVEGFQEHLHDVVKRNKNVFTIGDAWWYQIHATARQRAEAFLRTIGKWKD